MTTTTPLTTTENKTNGKCDGCNDFDNDEKHPLTYVAWTHHDPTHEEGWAYEDGQRVTGLYCPDCVASIRKVEHKRQTAKTYTVTIFQQVEVQAQSEREASELAFAIRAKLNVRELRVKIQES
jgi:hypothetical protein